MSDINPLSKLRFTAQPFDCFPAIMNITLQWNVIQFIKQSNSMDLDAIIHFHAELSPACFSSPPPNLIKFSDTEITVEPAELRCYSEISACRGSNGTS